MSYNLNSLIIVGYTEVPVLTPPRPRILSQIFRVDKKDIVLYPPYTLEDGLVTKPYVVNVSEFEESIRLGGGTKLPNPIKPKSNYFLWLNDKGRINYDSIEFITEQLNKIYKKYVGLAKKHPSKGLNYLIIARSAKPDGIEAQSLIKKYI